MKYIQTIQVSDRGHQIELTTWPAMRALAHLGELVEYGGQDCLRAILAILELPDGVLLELLTKMAGHPDGLAALRRQLVGAFLLTDDGRLALDKLLDDPGSPLSPLDLASAWTAVVRASLHDALAGRADMDRWVPHVSPQRAHQGVIPPNVHHMLVKACATGEDVDYAVYRDAHKALTLDGLMDLVELQDYRASWNHAELKNNDADTKAQEAASRRK